MWVPLIIMITWPHPPLTSIMFAPEMMREEVKHSQSLFRGNGKKGPGWCYGRRPHGVRAKKANRTDRQACSRRKIGAGRCVVHTQYLVLRFELLYSTNASRAVDLRTRFLLLFVVPVVVSPTLTSQYYISVVSNTGKRETILTMKA
jgi:hypothetical protein